MKKSILLTFFLLIPSISFSLQDYFYCRDILNKNYCDSLNQDAKLQEIRIISDSNLNHILKSTKIVEVNTGESIFRGNIKYLNGGISIDKKIIDFNSIKYIKVKEEKSILTALSFIPMPYLLCLAGEGLYYYKSRDFSMSRPLYFSIPISLIISTGYYIFQNDKKIIIKNNQKQQ